MRMGVRSLASLCGLRICSQAQTKTLAGVLGLDDIVFKHVFLPTRRLLQFTQAFRLRLLSLSQKKKKKKRNCQETVGLHCGIAVQELPQFAWSSSPACLSLTSWPLKVSGFRLWDPPTKLQVLPSSTVMSSIPAWDPRCPWAACPALHEVLRVSPFSGPLPHLQTGAPFKLTASYPSSFC